MILKLACVANVPAVALGRGTVGHVVEQALRGRADHRDDVPAGFGDGEAVDDVLVHVPRRGQHVAQRRRRPPLAEALAQRVALARARGDLGDAALALLRDPRPDRIVARSRQRAQVEPRPRRRPARSAGASGARRRAARCPASSRCPARARRGRRRGRRARSAAARRARLRRRRRAAARPCARPRRSSCRRSSRRPARRSAPPPRGRRRSRRGRGRAWRLIAGPSRSGRGSPRAACRVR